MRVILRAGLTVMVLLGCDGSDGSDASVPVDGADIDASGFDAGPRPDAGPQPDAGPPPDTGPRPDAGPPPGTVGEQARALATHLSGDAHFLVGMGNDLDGAPTYDPDMAGAFTLGTELDLHYMYLTGYSDRGGWATWNSDGSFVTIHGQAAGRNGGVAPMWTYYQLALDYETGADSLADADRMRQWLLDVELMFTRIGELGVPAVVHFEPDLFGYLQQRFTTMSTTADAYPMRLRHAGFDRCDALPEVAASFGACVAAIRDAVAPMVRVGLSASQWAVWYEPMDPGADVQGSAEAHAAFLRSMGADALDLIVVETLDRDAGFWETSGGTATCSVTGGSRGPVYWDETNTTFPNFAQHLAWVRALTAELERPALWWQTPFGVPSETCGGTDGAYRDNRVRYFFSHVDELIAAGGVGMVFGTGAGQQTYITSDGGQFSDAVGAYFAAPAPL